MLETPKPEFLRNLRAYRSVGVRSEPEEELVRDQLLVAIGVIDARLDAADEGVFEFLRDVAPDLPQLIGDDPVVVIAVLAADDPRTVAADLGPAPSLRRRQQDRVEVRIVERVREGCAIRPAGEVDVVEGTHAGAARAGIAFERQLVAIGLRVGDVGRSAPSVVALPLIVPAERIELGVTLEDVVAHDALDAVEAARRHQVAVGDCVRERNTAPKERQLDAPLHGVFLEV